MDVNSLDISTLLQVLQDFRQDGRLQAQLPIGVLGQSGGYASIEMLQGNMISCTIFNAQGQVLLRGQEALNTLSNLGSMQWVVNQEYIHTNPNLPAIRQNTSGTLHAIPRSFTGPQPMLQQNTSGNLQAVNGSFTRPQPVIHPAARFVPRRITTINSEILNRFPRRQKRVLLLVDGERNVAKIASMLNPQENGQQEIFTILRELEDMCVIIISRA